MKTRREICRELNIADRTFDLIVKYLNLNFIEKKHEKSHKICKFYSDEDEVKIRKFLADTPNTRAFFLNLSKIEKCGSLENFYKMKNEKSRKTKMERYGDPNYVNKEMISKSNKKSWDSNKQSRMRKTKKTKLEKYGDENYNNMEKNHQTIIKHYGSIKNAYKIVSEKSKKTKLEKYGDENYHNKEKERKTKLEKYGDEHYSNPEKRKKTNLKKYGAEVATKNKNVSEKISRTWHRKTHDELLEFVKKVEDTKIERYGNPHYVNGEKASETWKSKSDDEMNEISEKRKQTMIEKYGVEYPAQNEEVKNKIKETINQKYGKNPFKNGLIKEKIKQTNLERYGVEYPMQNKTVREKSKNTYNSHYGVGCLARKELKEKIIKNNFEKYNTEYPSQTENIKNKIKQTNLERYGVENPFQNETIKDKIKQSNLERYGVENPLQNESIKNKIKKNNLQKLNFAKLQNLFSIYDLVCRFNKDKTTILLVLKNLNIHTISFKSDNRLYISQSDISILEDYFAKTEMSGTSYSEKQVSEFIKSICDYEVIENSKEIIPPKELDVYVPQKNLAIEFNGLHWHNELHADRNYHLNKTIACNEKGIDLIHIFEDDWKNKREIVKSMIASRLGIYKRKIFARKCECQIINDKLWMKSFFNENHLQGYTNCDVFVGLFHNDELVQCMGINKKGFHDGNIELTRMASLLNVQVVGGFSKLMSYVHDKLGFNEITSYVYRAWFNGNGYLKSGFKVEKVNPPSYQYIVDSNRINKSHFRKNKIKTMYENDFLDYYDENKTEHELMLENGIYRIYDCGTIKMKYKFQ